MSGAESSRSDPFHATGHLDGGSSREGQQQDAVRINAVHDQVGDPVGQGLGLAGTGARDHKQGFGIGGRAVTNAMFDCAALLRVEVGEIIVSHRCCSLLCGLSFSDSVAAVTKMLGPQDDQSVRAEKTSTLAFRPQLVQCVVRVFVSTLQL